MKPFALALWFTLGLIVVGCGGYSNSNASNLNGTWTATLLGTNNASTAFNFSTNLMVNTNGSLTITNFQFSSSSPCFESGQTESGSFMVSGNYNGNVAGTLNFKVQSGTPPGNTLTLSGTEAGNRITGNWQLTGGTGCKGSGVFTMTKM
jgi:hypothetical protein